MLYGWAAATICTMNLEYFTIFHFDENFVDMIPSYFSSLERPQVLYCIMNVSMFTTITINTFETCNIIWATFPGDIQNINKHCRVNLNTPK